MHFLEKLPTQPLAHDGKVFAYYVVAHEFDQLQAEVVELRAKVARLESGEEAHIPHVVEANRDSD